MLLTSGAGHILFDAAPVLRTGSAKTLGSEE
jgi:hypothetical protein